VNRPRQLLIVGGFAKCGTTSLFGYLSQHPEICPSAIKETDFFVPTAEVLGEPRHAFPPLRFEGGWNSYATYFHHRARPVWLEASNYARFAASADNLYRSCPDAKLVFLVRHPLERTLSAFRFRKLVGTLPHRLSFEQYLARESEPGSHLLFGLGDLEMCRYSRFLEPFFARFPAAQIKVVGFAALARTPRSVLADICRWVGIDEQAVHKLHLAPRNVTYHPRSWWVHEFYGYFRTRVWKLRRYFPRAIERVVDVHQHTVGRFYRNWNDRSPTAENLSSAMRTHFQTVYETESEALYRMTGQAGLLEPLDPDQG